MSVLVDSSSLKDVVCLDVESRAVCISVLVVCDPIEGCN